jgi:hypothetical protein
MRRITTVEDTFQVTGRGLIVAPGPLRSEMEGAPEFAVELHRPDGSRVPARASLTHTFSSPPPPPLIAAQWTCTLFGVQKQDVPVGTEVWRVDAA